MLIHGELRPVMWLFVYHRELGLLPAHMGEDSAIYVVVCGSRCEVGGFYYLTGDWDVVV